MEPDEAGTRLNLEVRGGALTVKRIVLSNGTFLLLPVAETISASETRELRVSSRA